MAKPQLYILPDPHDHDRVQALRTVKPTKPKGKKNEEQYARRKKKNEGQAVWWTLYNLNREIRTFEGTVDDEEAELDYDLWMGPIARWAESNQDWADAAKLNAEDLFDGMDEQWPETAGTHRNPKQAAIDTYTVAAEAYAPESLRSPNQRRAATFCVCLANAKRDGGAFFLSRYDLGEVLGTNSTTAYNCLQKLARIGLLEIVKVGSLKDGATDYRLAGSLLQFYSVSDLQDPSDTRISGEIRAAYGLSPDLSQSDEPFHDHAQDRDHGHDHDLRHDRDFQVEAPIKFDASEVVPDDWDFSPAGPSPAPNDHEGQRRDQVRTQDRESRVDPTDEHRSLLDEVLKNLGASTGKSEHTVSEHVPRHRRRVGVSEPTRVGFITSDPVGDGTKMQSLRVWS